jgi:hypothetical protein
MAIDAAEGDKPSRLGSRTVAGSGDPDIIE